MKASQDRIHEVEQQLRDDFDRQARELIAKARQDLLEEQLDDIYQAFEKGSEL